MTDRQQTGIPAVSMANTKKEMLAAYQGLAPESHQLLRSPWRRGVP